MPGNHSRNKGHNFERWVTNQFKGLFPVVRRGLQSRDGSECPDVFAGPLWIECKRGASTQIKSALEQARVDSVHGGGKHYPVAVCKDDRKDPTCTMVLKDFLELIEALRDGDY